MIHYLFTHILLLERSGVQLLGVHGNGPMVLLVINEKVQVLSGLLLVSSDSLMWFCRA